MWYINCPIVVNWMLLLLLCAVVVAATLSLRWHTRATKIALAFDWCMNLVLLVVRKMLFVRFVSFIHMLFGFILYFYSTRSLSLSLYPYKYIYVCFILSSVRWISSTIAFYLILFSSLLFTLLLLTWQIAIRTHITNESTKSLT